MPVQEHVSETVGALACAGMRGGANVGAGTGGILEYRWCKRSSQAKPAPTAVFLCSAMPAEAPARGNPMTRALCVQGACAGEADQFCKLFQQALLGKLSGFTVMLLWSGYISVKPVCYRTALAFPLLFLHAEKSEDAFIFC